MGAVHTRKQSHTHTQAPDYLLLIRRTLNASRGSESIEINCNAHSTQNKPYLLLSSWTTFPFHFLFGVSVVNLIANTMTARAHTLWRVQVPAHLCVLSTKILPTFPYVYAFNISYLFVCRFGLTHAPDSHTRRQAHTQVLRLLLLAIHISSVRKGGGGGKPRRLSPFCRSTTTGQS